MILYSYDHCPYCVKARMIFGLKQVPFELKTLLNDDEKTPISMVGKKMLPILQKDDGTYLPESLDIIDYIDHLPEFGEPIVNASHQSQELSDWLGFSRRYTYALAMPRWVNMGLEDFATPSATQYFIRKKQDSIGPFSANITLTKELILYAQGHLQKLEQIISSGPYFWGSELSIDDFHVFATLRCLTTTKGLQFPPKIEAYMSRMSEASGVDLHWSRALGEDIDVPE